MNKKLNIIQQAAFEGMVAGQVKAMDAVGKVRSRPMSSGLIIASVLTVLLAATAIAAPAGCAKDDGAAGSLVDFIDSITKFVILIASAISGVAFAAGAFMIIIGGDGSKVAKGKKYVLNAIIGLMILAGFWLIKSVVIGVIQGAAGSNQNQACLGGKGL